MNSMLISIIVPVYNVEKYLKYCVNSLTNQTYENIEILLINDGSTDSSGNIAEELAKQDKRIRVHHKENGGLSDARNYGVLHAKSDWIMFIDSDDFYEPFAVEYFVGIQEKYQADLILSALKGVSNHKTLNSRNISADDVNKAYFLSRERALEEMFYSGVTGASACGKLFRKELLMKHPYPYGKVYEDLAVTYKHIYESNNIYVAPMKVYGYFKRDGSIVNSKFNEKYLYAFEIIDNAYNFTKENYSSSSDIIRAIDVRNVLISMQVANSMLMADMHSDVKSIRKRIWKYRKSFINNDRVAWKNKMKYLLFLTFPKLYNYLRLRLLK